MNEFLKEALAKLDAGVKADCGRHGNVMKKDVRDALADFCKQDAEFAQAVAQGGDFKDCMAKVAKGVTGNGISDMKAFGLAVEFYFPGAGIDVKMTIDLCASVGAAEKRAGGTFLASDRSGCAARREAETKAGVVIDLSAFF